MLSGAPSASRFAHRPDLHRMVVMMVLFFLVVCAVGILRPIKNALALDGLGATDFYKVYLVSAVVILFVPLYNRAADRLASRWLIPVVSLFFAAQLVLLRMLYVEGSTAFGLVFYGWYDLFAGGAVLHGRTAVPRCATRSARVPRRDRRRRARCDAGRCDHRASRRAYRHAEPDAGCGCTDQRLQRCDADRMA